MTEENMIQLVSVLQDIKQELSSIAESLYTLSNTPPDHNFHGIEERLRRIGCFVEDLSLKK